MTRLYLDFTPSDKVIVLPAEESHYLTRVLRLKVGDIVHVYNERVGEWEVVLSEVTKSSCVLALQQQLRKAIVEPITRLVYAPLKHDAMAFLLEKATELGVTHLQPMVTDFAQKYAVHADKIERQLKQASQQCERLFVPVLLPPKAFDMVIRECGDGAYIALERADASSLAHVLAMKDVSEPCTFIVGPEGGFSSREVELIKSIPGIQVVSLGRTVLRAETAAIVGMGAISMWRG
ncbi:MAG: RsmE family RNA methyltransferase [Pseudomonadota bacterium]